MKNRVVITAAAAALLVALLSGCDTRLNIFGKKEEAEPVSNIEEKAVITFLDCGQADCAVIESGDSVIVIDTGSDPDALMTFMQREDIKKVDLLIVSHPHSDHYGGATELIENYNVGEIIMAAPVEGLTPDNSWYLDLVYTIDRCRVPLTYAENGMTRTLSSVTLTQYTFDDPYDVNELSVVTYLCCDKANVIFCADQSRYGEEDIMNREDVEAEIIKLGHHGSYTSSGRNFMRDVNPKLAVISCGELNSYGYPHDETVQLLESMRILSYITWQTGNIRCATDGNVFSVTCENGQSCEINCK